MFTRTETLGLLLLFHYYNFIFSSPCLPFKLISGGSAGKESSCNAGDLSLIPGLGRSPGEGNSYSLQYSDLENSMDYIVHGVTKSQAWLNNIHFLFWNKYVCLVCGKLTSNGIKLNLWKFQVHIDTRKLIIFHMTFQYCLLKLRNAVGINLSC